MNRSQAGVGDDATLEDESSGVDVSNQKAQDASQPYIAANEKSKDKSMKSPKKTKMKSPQQVMDKSEYEDDDEYYDSEEDSYDDQDDAG